jgi:hypothetical protein
VLDGILALALTGAWIHGKEELGAIAVVGVGPVHRLFEPVEPMVAVTGNGTVAVTYYQLRHAAAGKNQWLTDYWIRTSTDGGRVFGAPRHVAGPFDITNAPIMSGGYFVGDYEGLAANTKSFALLFVQTSPKAASAPTHVFAATVNG